LQRATIRYDYCRPPNTCNSSRARRHRTLPLSSRRSRVLLCWGYYRRGWIAPFEELRDEFDFHYLFHLSKEEEECSHTKQPRHYWNEFGAAQEILDEVKPDKLVFMSLSGLRPIALNMAARRRAIPTFIFQHGYFRSLENYLSLPPLAVVRGAGTKVTTQSSSAWQAIRFMLRSNLAEEPTDCLRAVAMLLMSRRTNPYRSQLRFRFRGRMPDRYITYSEATSEIYRQLDGASSSSIIPVGIPEFDPLFRLLANPAEACTKNILLIDSPNAENRYGATTTTIESKVGFLCELSLRLEQRGCALIVKLHPETYGATWLPSPGKIQYVRDDDVGPLIQGAHACLGFDSTLMIPAIIARPTMLFELCESTLTSDARRLGVATVVRGLEASNEELSALLEGKERSAEQLHGFTHRFAHSADGNATKRLADALRGSDL
jgi:hypothetical protein